MQELFELSIFRTQQRFHIRHPVLAEDVRTPAFVATTEDGPAGEPAAQTGPVAGADYVEITDAPKDVSTPYELVAGDTLTGTILSGLDRDWFRISVNPGAIIEINSTTPVENSWIGGGLYDQDGGFIKGRDQYFIGRTKIIYENESDELQTLYLEVDVSGNINAARPFEYTFTVEEISPDRYRFLEGIDAPDDDSTPYELVVGETFSGVIRGEFEEDWIRVTVEAGQTVEVTVGADVDAAYERVVATLVDEHDRMLKTADTFTNSRSVLSYENSSTESVEIYVNVDGWSVDEYFDYTVTVEDITPQPITEYTNDEIADYLTSGYWGGEYSFDIAPGGTLTVDITGLTADGRYLARNALEAWTAVSGIDFRFVSSGAQITFDDTEAGAFAQFYNSGSTITSADVNISTGWLNAYGTTLNTYSFQTYIHEIGHALGLGHAGNYNGSASYGTDNHYLNDSWQATIMSYFDQDENTYVDANFALVLTPQVADIIAIRNLYGTTGETRTGNTTYGDGANSGDLMETLSGINDTPISVTIVDDGGIDTLNFSSSRANQAIDLREEAISSVRGLTGNLIISRGTVIENARTGSGRDVLKGNDTENTLNGGGGRDLLFGFGGDDRLEGGAGDDYLDAGASGGSWQYMFGGSGYDQYHVSTDNGLVLLHDNTGYDKIYFQDISYSELDFSSYDYSGGSAWGSTLDLMWSDGGGGRLRVTQDARYINYFHFEDGMALTSLRMLGNDYMQLVGTSADNELTGGAAREKIYAGGGDDKLNAGESSGSWQYLYGETGNDTYYYERVGGNVFIEDTSGTDTLKFLDLSFADLDISATNYGSSHSWGTTLNLAWDISGSSGQVRLTDQARDIELFLFDDGRMLQSISFLGGDNLQLVGTSRGDIITGNDLRVKIYGGDGNDILSAGEGPGGWQYLIGENGDDLYRYAEADGTVFIDDTDGSNRIRFSDLDFSDFTFGSSDYGSHRWGETLNMVSAGGELRIGDNASSINSFEFASGMVLKTIRLEASDRLLVIGKSGDDMITGSDLRDKIYGGSGDDTLDAGGTTDGWQYLYGDSGNDTFLYSQSNGNVFVDDSSGANDILRFTDLDRGDVTVSTTDYGSHPWGETLNLSWDTGGDSGEVRVTNLGSEIEQFIFSDGAIFSADDFFV